MTMDIQVELTINELETDFYIEMLRKLKTSFKITSTSYQTNKKMNICIEKKGYMKVFVDSGHNFITNDYKDIQEVIISSGKTGVKFHDGTIIEIIFY